MTLYTSAEKNARARAGHSVSFSHFPSKSTFSARGNLVFRERFQHLLCRPQQFLPAVGNATADRPFPQSVQHAAHTAQRNSRRAEQGQQIVPGNGQRFQGQGRAAFPKGANPSGQSISPFLLSQGRAHLTHALQHLQPSAGQLNLRWFVQQKRSSSGHAPI